MDDKFTYYDVIAHIVPGTLVLGVLALLPEVFGFQVPTPKSDLIAVVAGLPVTYTIGQVVQGLSSLMQPVYYKLWGGMPSTVIVEGHSKRLKGERLERVMGALTAYFDSPSETTNEREALISDAMALCNREALGRVADFNASYAFHRALLTTGAVTTILLAVAVFSANASVRPGAIYFGCLALALTAIEFVRARQRGEYFAVEVLNMAYIETKKAGTVTA
jgi:hypothetical protein